MIFCSRVFICGVFPLFDDISYFFNCAAFCINGGLVDGVSTSPHGSGPSTPQAAALTPKSYPVAESPAAVPGVENAALAALPRQTAVPGRATDPVNTQNRQFCAMDMFPTTLAAMGCIIEGERLGLGTNLFSGRPTLMEEMGYAKLCTELSKKSEYYSENFYGEIKEVIPTEPSTQGKGFETIN